MARIMICDDSKVALKLLESNLRSAGHDVVGAGKDGEEGIRIYQETKPDIALLDVTMPNKDGRECLEAILKINPAAKVIMISSLREESLIQDCLSQGAKAFIAKSNLYAEDGIKKHLLSLIEKILEAA